MENRQLREVLKAVLDELLKHGADIHDFIPPNEEGLSQVSVILRNLNEGRELLDGLHGPDPDSSAFKPYTMKYRGKEQLIWAVFPIRGPLPEALRGVNERIFSEWLPALRDYDLRATVWSAMTYPTNTRRGAGTRIIILKSGFR